MLVKDEIMQGSWQKLQHLYHQKGSNLMMMWQKMEVEVEA